MPERQRDPGDVTHTMLSVLSLACLILATFWVLRPFLTSILWATIIVVALWPFLLRLQGYVGGRRGLAVAIMTLGTLLVVFVPVTLALVTIVKNAQSVGEGIQSLESMPVPDPPPVLEEVPFAGKKLAERWRSFAALSPEERSARIAPHAQTALQWFAVKAGSVGSMLIQFLLTTIISAILFARGEIVRDGILAFARRLAGQQGYDAAIRGAQAIRGVVLGVVVTALVQAAIAGTGLFLSGIPAAPLLTAVIVFLCLAQVGPFLIVIPAIIWLYSSGQAGGGTVLLVLGVIAGTIDNVIRPVLIRRGADLPLLLIFGGVIGGLIAFGVIGLFIGPVVLTVAYTLLTTWVREGEASVPSVHGV